MKPYTFTSAWTSFLAGPLAGCDAFVAAGLRDIFCAGGQAMLICAIEAMRTQLGPESCNALDALSAEISALFADADDSTPEERH